MTRSERRAQLLRALRELETGKALRAIRGLRVSRRLWDRQALQAEKTHEVIEALKNRPPHEHQD